MPLYDCNVIMMIQYLLWSIDQVTYSADGMATGTGTYVYDRRLLRNGLEKKNDTVGD